MKKLGIALLSILSLTISGCSLLPTDFDTDPNPNPTIPEGHGTSQDDPLTVEEASAICEQLGYSTSEKQYYVQGVVGEITYPYNTGNKDAGNTMSFMISDDLNTTPTMRCYDCYLASGVQHKYVVYGTRVLVECFLSSYGGGATTKTGGTVLQATRETEPEIIPVSCTQALSIAQSLSVNETTTTYYQVTGYVVSKSGSNCYINDTPGIVANCDNSVYVYAKTIYDLRYKLDAITVGAYISVTALLKHYVSSSNSSSYNFELYNLIDVELRSPVVNGCSVYINNNYYQIYQASTISVPEPCIGHFELDGLLMDSSYPFFFTYNGKEILVENGGPSDSLYSVQTGFPCLFVMLPQTIQNAHIALTIYENRNVVTITSNY